MATDVERLAVLIEANTKSYERAMSKLQSDTQRSLSRVEKQYKDSGDRVNTFLSKIGFTLFAGGAVAAAAAATSAFKNVISGLGDIKDAAERAGVSTDFLQAVGFQLQQAGGSMEDAARGAAKFGKELGDVNVQQSYLGRLLAANGVNIKSFGSNGQAAFEAFARVVANARTPQEAMNMVAQVFGDRVGPKMLTTIQEIGRVGLPQFIEQMRAAGHVISEELINKGDELDDKWNALMDRLKKGAQSFVVNTIEYFDALEHKLNELAGIASSFDERFFFKAPRVTVNAKPSTNVPTSAPKEDEFLKNIHRLEDQIELMEREGQVINQTTAAREAATVAIKLEQAAREANAEQGKTIVSVTAAQRAEIDRVAEAYGRMAAALERAKGPMGTFIREGSNLRVQMEDAVVNGLKGFEDALIGIIQGTKDAKEAFRDMANAIIADLLRIAIRQNLTVPLAGAFQSLFTFGRAAGGPVSSGQAYMVGERGPELFVPRDAGRIMSASDLNNGGSPRVTVNVFEGAGGDKTKQRQRSNGRGDTVIDVLTAATQKMVGDGRLDDSFRGRFGADSLAIQRG